MFYDYSKASDGKEHEKAWVALKEEGVPQPLTVLMRNVTCAVDGESQSGQSMERQNDFLQAKVSDEDAFHLPICLISIQNISYEKLG